MTLRSVSRPVKIDRPGYGPLAVTRELDAGIDADQTALGKQRAAPNKTRCVEMDLKSFVSEQNIARYRRMLARCDDDKQRRIIDRLLSAEIATRNGATPGPSFATFHGVAAGLTQGAET